MTAIQVRPLNSLQTIEPNHALGRGGLRPLRAALAALLPLLLGVGTATATDVPGGTIAASATWTAGGSPYVVKGAVTVGAGATLTIAAGVQVRFATGCELNVADGGALVATGTAGQKIAFTSDAATPAKGDWYYIRAFAGARLRLTYCDVAYAGRGNYAAVTVFATDTEIRNCRIHDNAFRAVHFDGAGLAPLLASTQIDGNGEIAVYQTTVDMTPTYQGVSMSGNGTNAVVIPGGTVHRAVTIDGSAAALSGASPLITSGITVAGDGALTITPGSTLRFATGTELNVSDGGSLTAQGTPAAPISFTSAASPQQRGDWYYLRAFAGAHVRLSYLDLAYAGRGNYPALLVYATDSVIADSRVHDNAATGLQLEGPGLTPTVTGTRIDHNGGVALYQSTINMAPVLADLTLDGNDTDALVIAAPSVTTAVALDGSADVLNGAPVVLTASLAVQNGGSLTIAPGTTVKGPPGWAADVFEGGTFTAVGTAAEPIALTSTSAAPAAGDWYHLRAFAGAALHAEHLDLGYAGRGNYPSLWLLTSNAEVRDCRVHHGGSTGIQLEGAGITPTLADVTIDHNGAGALYQTTINMAPVLSNLTLTDNAVNARIIGAPSVTTGVVLDGSAGVLNGAPIVVGGSLGVQAGATLTVAPGTTLRLPAGGAFDVMGGGTLIARGTVAEPIVITPDLATPVPGSLYHLRGFAGAVLRLEHVDLGFAGRGNYPSLWLLTSDAQVRDCRIHHGAWTGVQLDGAGLTPELTRVAIDHNGAAALYQTTINMTPALAAVTMSDNGRDVLMMPGGTVDRAVTLDGGAARIGGKPVVLTGSLGVGATGVLTIAPATSVLLPLGGEINLLDGGTLLANGTAAAPVVLSPDTATPKAGDWYYVRAFAGSHLRLTHVELGFAGRGGYPSLLVRTKDATVAGCRIHDSAADGLQTAEESFPRLTANQIAGNAFGARNYNAVNWVDARFTWWGDPTGPYHPVVNPGGKGNAVSDKVLFEPWAVDEQGTLSSTQVVQVRGPARGASGETLDYSVYWATYTDLDDAVLAVTLPFTAEYVPQSADGLYYPELRQVFWRLGNLAAGSEGTTPLRIRHGWGIPDGLQDELDGFLFGANQSTADQTVDVEPYTSFTAVTPTSHRKMSASEVSAALSASAPLKAIVDQATAGDYLMLGGFDNMLSDGDAFVELVLIRKDRHGAMLLRRRAATGQVIRSVVTPTEYAIDDGAGGLVATAPDGPISYWGTWADPATQLGVHSAAASYFSGCMRNCIASNLGTYILGKVCKYVDQALQIRDCVNAALSQGQDENALAACAVNLGSIAVEKLAMVKDEINLFYPCIKDCAADPWSWRCRQSIIIPNPAPQQRGWLAPAFEDPARTYTFLRCDPSTRMLDEPVTRSCPPGFQPVANYWNRNINPPGPCLEVGLDKAVADLYKDIDVRQQKGLRILGYGRTRQTLRRAKDPNAKYGVAGDVLAGERLSYTVTCENEGAGTAYGVFILDQLHESLDETTLAIDGNGTYIPAARTITWDVGELTPKGQPGSTGSVSFSVAARSDLPVGTAIPNRAVVYFPSVPEETPTNWVVNTVAAVTAHPQELETAFATPVAVTLAGSPDTSPPLTFAVVHPPSYGTLTGTPPLLTYTPAAGFVGDDRLSFTVASATETSASAEITITVAAPTNDSTRPQVAWVWPAAGATVTSLGVKPVGMDGDGPMYAPPLLVEVSELLGSATVSAGTVQVVDANGHHVPVSVTFDTAAKRLLIALRERWRATRYTVTVGTGIADLAGNHLAAPYSWSFIASPPGSIRERLYAEP